MESRISVILLHSAHLCDPSRGNGTEANKIHKGKSSIRNRIDDEKNSVDIVNAFSVQDSNLYSSVPIEPNCLSVTYA